MELELPLSLLSCHVFRCIKEQLQHARLHGLIEGLQLTDPQFSAADPIEMLLGAEVCSIILQEGLRKGDPHTPIAQHTLLGWILSRGCGENLPATPHRSFQCTADHELTALVQRFWEQEKEPSASVSITPDEQRCEEFFAQTHSRTAAGRYIVRLPFAAPPAALGDTRQSAERLLTAMERRCDCNSIRKSVPRLSEGI